MIDPMLATGGSAVAALDHLTQAGARDIRMICIVAAPEGVELVQKHHPGVRIYTPAIDRHLNDHKFIVPGPGRFRRSAVRDAMTKPRERQTAAPPRKRSNTNSGAPH